MTSPEPPLPPIPLILQKLNSAPIYQSKRDIQKQLMARILSSRDKLISTYFYKLPKDQGRRNQSSSSKSAKHASNETLSTPDMIFFKYWDNSPSHLSTSSNLNAWKIKFLLSTTTPDPGMWTKFTNRMVSRTGSWLDWLPEFGLFHTALIVGPHKIEWIDSSLCVPRAVQTTNAVLLIDICTIEGSMHYKWIRERMAERIEWWNLNMNYSHRANSAQWQETKMGNCQQFVMDIIQHLNLETQFRKQLRHVQPVLNRIVRNGDAIMELAVSRPFFDMFPLSQDELDESEDAERRKALQLRLLDHREGQLPTQDGITLSKFSPGMVLKFETHSQLDRYVSMLLLIDPYLLQKEFDEVQILKSFDRAFWLQKKKHEYLRQTDPQHEIPQFCMESNEGSCPFSQPDLTHSIMDMPEASFTVVIQEFKEELQRGAGENGGNTEGDSKQGA